MDSLKYERNTNLRWDWVYSVISLWPVGLYMCLHIQIKVSGLGQRFENECKCNKATKWTLIITIFL